MGDKKRLKNFFFKKMTNMGRTYNALRFASLASKNIIIKQFHTTEFVTANESILQST